MKEKAERGTWPAIRGFLIKWVLPIGLGILAIISILSVIKGGNGFKWLAKLKHGAKKKQMEEEVRKTMIKVEAREEKIATLKEKVKSNKGDAAVHKENIKALQKERKEFSQKVDKAKKNQEEFNSMVDDLL